MDIATFLEGAGAYVPRSAGWRKLRCPFHEDSNPSATVNVDIGRFFCFVCGINEDLIGLMMLREGVTFAEAKQAAEEGVGTNDNQLRGGSAAGDWLPSRPRDRGPRRDSDSSSWRSRLP